MYKSCSGFLGMNFLFVYMLLRKLAAEEFNISFTKNKKFSSFNFHIGFIHQFGKIFLPKFFRED